MFYLRVKGIMYLTLVEEQIWIKMFMFKFGGNSLKMKTEYNRNIIYFLLEHILY